MTAPIGNTSHLITLADLVENLGHIPLGRIRLHPPPGTACEADLSVLTQRPGKVHCELVEGVLVEKAMGFRESGLASFLIGMFTEFVLAKNLGIVTGEAGTVRLYPGLVRIPDVAFTSWARLPGRRYPKDPVPDVVPDFVVEVLSAGNTPKEMDRKRREYFWAGVALVWIIDAEQRTISVFTSAAPDQAEVRTGADTIDGGTVLPGFTVQVGGRFAELDRHG